MIGTPPMKSVEKTALGRILRDPAMEMNPARALLIEFWRVDRGGGLQPMPEAQKEGTMTPDLKKNTTTLDLGVQKIPEF